jgi:hypothetical protein
MRWRSASAFSRPAHGQSVIHQQGHFVVRLNPSSQLPIELFIHGQRFGVQCVHGFFGLNAFLLGFPFSQRATCRIAQLVTCVNEPLNFASAGRTASLRRFRSRAPACRLPSCCAIPAPPGCDTVTTFLGGQVRNLVHGLANLLQVSVKTASPLQGRRLFWFFSMTVKSIISLMVSPEIWL